MKTKVLFLIILLFTIPFFVLAVAGNMQDPDLTFIGENTLDYFGVCTNPAGDVNGDGYDDFIIGAPDYNLKTGRAYLYYGSPSPDSIPDVIFNGEISWYPFFGNSATGAGDLNGDGYDDIVIGAYGYSALNGRAYIFFGGTNMDNIPDLILEGEQVFNVFGMKVAKAGDVNGDGFSDIIIGARGYNGWTGRAYIYFGGTSMDNIADIIMTGETTNDQFGCSVSSAGDVNADGFSDVIVGAYQYGINTGRSYIYYGSASMDNIPDLIMTGDGIDNYFGAYTASAGDVNNDGYSDFVVGADEYSHSTNKVYLYYGGTAPDNIPDLIIHGENEGDHFAPVFNNDDFNGDSYSDVFIGAWGFDSRKGKAYLFNGSTNMDTVIDFSATGEDTGSFFGSYLSSAGDINGDKYPDMIVGASSYQNNRGKAYMYFGSGDPVKTLSQIEVSPNVTIKHINEQVYVRGTVKNLWNQYMSNIRINFFIKGANDGYGYGISDGSGEVGYYYTGVNPGIDTVIAVSGKFRDTAIVFWESQFTCIAGPEYVERNSVNIYFRDFYSEWLWWEISNYGQAEARIISSNQNDSVKIDAGNKFGHFALMLVSGYQVVCTKYIYIDTPMPVELSSFSSIISGRDIILNWSTTSELNNSGFEIQRHESNQNTKDTWIKRGFVTGKGNSSTISNYEFTEKNLNSGKYNYRLKQIDFNGNFEYYDLPEVVNIGIPDNYSLSQNYPNPFNPVTNLEFEIPKLGFVTLKIYDVIGRELVTLVNEMKEPGYYIVRFDGSNLSSGVYFYRMTAGNFVAVKKLVLMK